MGTIKTTNIEPIADNGTVTLGSSGDTFTIGSGVTQSNLMYPAFEATISANQNITDSSNSKVNFNSENFDTDSCYDHTTNYRFTPNKAGKYYVYSNLFLDSDGGEDIDRIFAIIYKNGSTTVQSGFRQEHDFVFKSQPVRGIIDMNGSSDYLEMYAFVNTISGTPFVRTDTVNDTIFGAYRIGS